MGRGEARKARYRWEAAEETVGVERLVALVFAVAKFARCAVAVHVQRTQDGSVNVAHCAARAVLVQAPVPGRGVTGRPAVGIAAGPEVCTWEGNQPRRYMGKQTVG